MDRTMEGQMRTLIEDFVEQSLVMKAIILWGWLCVLVMIASFAYSANDYWKKLQEEKAEKEAAAAVEILHSPAVGG